MTVADVLAAQSPPWEPGTAHTYHAMTVGWLAGEILCHATGQRPSQRGDADRRAELLCEALRSCL